MSPCKYCENRHSRCHSKCEAYKEYREYLDQLNKRKHSTERADADFKEVFFEYYNKQKKKAHRYK